MTLSGPLGFHTPRSRGREPSDLLRPAGFFMRAIRKRSPLVPGAIASRLCFDRQRLRVAGERAVGVRDRQHARSGGSVGRDIDGEGQVAAGAPRLLRGDAHVRAEVDRSVVAQVGALGDELDVLQADGDLLRRDGDGRDCHRPAGAAPPERGKRDDHSAAGAVVDAGDRPVRVEVDRGQHDARVLRARRTVGQWSAQAVAEGLERGRRALVARRTALERAELVAVLPARVLAGGVIAAAAGWLDAHRPREALLVAHGQPDPARRPVGPDVAAPRIAELAFGISRHDDDAARAQVEDAVAADRDLVSVAVDQEAGPDPDLPRLGAVALLGRDAAHLRATHDAPAVQHPVVPAQALAPGAAAGGADAVVRGGDEGTGRQRAAAPVVRPPLRELLVVEAPAAERVRDPAGRLVVRRTLVAQLDPVLLANSARRARVDGAAIASQHHRRIAAALVVADDDPDARVVPAVAGAVECRVDEVGGDGNPPRALGDDDLTAPTVDREARCDRDPVPGVAQLDAEAADDPSTEHEPVEETPLPGRVAGLELEVLDAEELAVEVVVPCRDLEPPSAAIRRLSSVHRSSLRPKAALVAQLSVAVSVNSICPTPLVTPIRAPGAPASTTSASPASSSSVGSGGPARTASTPTRAWTPTRSFGSTTHRWYAVCAGRSRSRNARTPAATASL